MICFCSEKDYVEVPLIFFGNFLSCFPILNFRVLCDTLRTFYNELRVDVLHPWSFICAQQVLVVHECERCEGVRRGRLSVP